MSETVDDFGPEPPMRDGIPISWPLYADWHRRRADMAEGMLREASEWMDDHCDYGMDEDTCDDILSRIAAHLGDRK